MMNAARLAILPLSIVVTMAGCFEAGEDLSADDDASLRKCNRKTGRWCDAGGGEPDPEPTPEPTLDAGAPADAGLPGSGTWPVLRAFPGAEGFGTQTIGGRGGKVIKVTNLNDSGPGSFREAVTASGPRIVVFDVSGTIKLASRVVITSPYLTIAGQTAPGGGITLAAAPSNRKGTMYISTHDVVMRFLRLRPGTPSGTTDSSDGLTVWNNGAGDPYNVVVDHCSFSWATDENLATYHGAHDLTFSWNITAEALSNGMHPEGEHSKGMHMSGDGTHSLSVHHNLIAHNMDRNPQPTNPGLADYRNNVVYNYGKHGCFVSNSKGRPVLNFIGNYYKPGPDTKSGIYELDVYDGSGVGWELFVKGNIGPHRPTLAQPDSDFMAPEGRSSMVATEYKVAPVTTTDAMTAYDQVLARAGVTAPMRDAVDARIVGEVKGGTGSLIDHESDVGGYPALATAPAPVDTDKDGMPDDWETARGLDPTVDDSAKDRNGDGYTNLEEYIGLLAK